MSCEPVRFVYFDLGNVLATFDVGRACANLAESWAVDPLRVRREIWDSGLQDRWEHGELSDGAMADQIRQRLGISEQAAPNDRLLDRLCDMFQPLAAMVPIVQAVVDSGIPTGILSNTCRAHWQWLGRGGYASLQHDFDALILSFEMGVMKPAEAIYIAAEQRAGVPRESLLFLDDRQENVAAAQARGWQAHRFTGVSSALEVLQQTGVLR